MTTARLETLAWVAIYAGMALIALGVSMRHNGAELGWAVAAAGTFGVVVGAVLVWVRSRMNVEP